MTVQEFLDLMVPLAVADMKKSGVLASVTLAQVILESGWITSELAVNANNIFGMKAELSGNTWPGSTWNGEVYEKETAEQREDGSYYTVVAPFRKYQDIAQSVADHSAYLTGALDDNGNLRYAGIKGEKDARTALTIIKQGGYATSKDYVEKLMLRVDKYNLTKYDNAESEGETMKEIKIMLDAGHYGKYNRSQAVPAYYESDFTFKFVNMLKAALEACGFTVGTTRKDQAKDLGLTNRGKAAKGYNLFISIHSNAVGSGVNNSVDYPVAITMVNDDKVSIDEESKAVGEILAQVVASVMGTSQAARTYTKLSTNDRDGNGIKDDEYYGVLHGAKLVGVPGIILEHSFHTNARAAAWLLVEGNLQAMAAAEAAALANYYGMKKQEDQEPGQTQQPQEQQVAVTWYRVRTSWDNAASQIGAYRAKHNAIKNCPEGYTVYGDNGAVIYSNKKEDTAATKWYRVRKNWEDAASQLGAYKVYDNAVNNCPAGYAVFNDSGEVLYRMAAACEYVVKSGDTLGEIAKKYATSVDKIVQDNKAKYPKITPNFIRAGWKLVIK
jgi:N-acetylmuramoyl-L-alanine amidase